MNEELEIKFWGVRGSYPTPGAGTVKYGGNTACVEIRATTPPHAPSTRTGANCAAVARPSATPSSVSSFTTQMIDIDCIQVPAWLTS